MPKGISMQRISLLCIALLAIAGCTTLTPSWISTTTPADFATAPPRTAAQPQTVGEELKTQPRPLKLDNRAMADYFRELAKGTGLEDSRSYAEARKCYEELIQQWPTRYEAYHRLGRICDRQKRFAEAQQNYQQAILLAENREPDLFNDLGYSFFLQGTLSKAEIAIRKAVALRPTEPKYHNNLGLIYGHQRRFEDAWSEFRKAGGDADAFYNLAFIKSSLNDFEGAKACFRRALAIDPSHDRARRALRAFELGESDPDSLAQLETSTDDGTEWVPYVENGQNQGQDSSMASAAKNPGRRGENGRIVRQPGGYQPKCTCQPRNLTGVPYSAGQSARSVRFLDFGERQQSPGNGQSILSGQAKFASIASKFLRANLGNFGSFSSFCSFGYWLIHHNVYEFANFAQSFHTSSSDHHQIIRRQICRDGTKS